MRRILASALLSLVMLASAGVTLTQARDETADEDPVAAEVMSREDAVARVLATDPRFALLTDFDTLRRRAAASFRLDEYLTSGYYRVLGPTLSELADGGWVSFRAPIGRLIEVNLAADCAEIEWDGLPTPVTDPCTWRHTWIYAVETDGTVLPVFDIGDPEPMP